MTSKFDLELRSAQWPQSAGALAAVGVTRDMTRGPRWRRTSRGFFVAASIEQTTTQHILDVAPLIPGNGALAGWAAAYAHGVDWLDGREPETMARQPIVINLGRDLGRADTSTVHYVRERLPSAHWQTVAGLNLTTPPRTAFDGVRWAPDLVEAVVFLDQLTHTLGITLEQLTPWASPRTHWAGIEQYRHALRLADPRSASPWESRLRMFYVLRAKLPRPEVNVPVFTLDERLLGVADLLDEEAGLVTEFDGKDHRLRHQHRADNLREEKLEAANLVVCRVDSLDLRQPVPLAERLQARRVQGMRRDRRRDAWTLEQPAWWRRRFAS